MRRYFHLDDSFEFSTVKRQQIKLSRIELHHALLTEFNSRLVSENNVIDIKIMIKASFLNIQNNNYFDFMLNLGQTKHVYS